MFILKMAASAILPQRVPADDVHAPAQPFVLPQGIRRDDGNQAGEGDHRQGAGHKGFHPAWNSQPMSSSRASHTCRVRESLAQEWRKLNLQRPSH